MEWSQVNKVSKRSFFLCQLRYLFLFPATPSSPLEPKPAYRKPSKEAEEEEGLVTKKTPNVPEEGTQQRPLDIELDEDEKDKAKSPKKPPQKTPRKRLRKKKDSEDSDEVSFFLLLKLKTTHFI